MAKKQKQQSIEESNLRIVHNMVGPYPAGRVVSVAEMRKRFGEDLDLGRLLSIGAVEVVKDGSDPDDPSTLPAGPENSPKDMKRVNATNEVDGDSDPDEAHGGEDTESDDSDDPDEADESDDETEESEEDDAESSVVTDPKAEGFDPAALTTEQLREAAKAQGVKNYKTLSRAKLITALAPE